MTDYCVLIEDLKAPCKYFKQNSGWENNLYICQNDTTASETIEEIEKAFNPEEDYLYVILDFDLGRLAKRNGVDFFELILNKFPNDKIYFICFSSDPTNFIKLLQDKGITRKFDFITNGSKPSQAVIDHINAHKTQRLTEIKNILSPPTKIYDEETLNLYAKTKLKEEDADIQRTSDILTDQANSQRALFRNEYERLFRTAMSFFCCCCSNKPSSATVHLTTRSNDSSI